MNDRWSPAGPIEEGEHWLVMDTNRFDPFDYIEHPAKCEPIYDDEYPMPTPRCAVAWQEDGGGLWESLAYGGAPLPVTGGRYRIAAWATYTDVPWCGREYDGGLYLVDLGEKP